MNVDIKVILHKHQRYETVGDWWWKGDKLCIRVSDMGNWKYECLVAVHELIEVLLCKHEGIKQEDVDRFDIEFEKNRKQGNEDEPGDDPKAPYRKQHLIATGVEKVLAALLGVDWNSYDDKVCSL